MEIKNIIIPPEILDNRDLKTQILPVEVLNWIQRLLAHACHDS